MFKRPRRIGKVGLRRPVEAESVAPLSEVPGDVHGIVERRLPGSSILRRRTVQREVVVGLSGSAVWEQGSNRRVLNAPFIFRPANRRRRWDGDLVALEESLVLFLRTSDLEDHLTHLAS